MIISQHGLVYALCEPKSGDIRYIGQTTTSLKQRLRKHISDSRHGVTYTHCWIKSVLNKGERPIIREVESCLIAELDNREIYYISLYKKQGLKLTNLSEGGQTRRVHSKETNQKISASLTGKKQSTETRKRRSASSKETWKSPELRELKRNQTVLLNQQGLIGTKGKPSNKKGKSFEGDKVKLAASLKKYYQTDGASDKNSLAQGAKMFNVFSIKSVRHGNRFRKETVIEKGRYLFEAFNVSETARKLNLQCPLISKCLKGIRKHTGNYIFEYKN